MTQLRIYISTNIQPWEQTSEYKAGRDILAAVTVARTQLQHKDAQLRFAMALLPGFDVSCVIATGFGNSLAFQMAVMMLERKFALVITPLNRLGEDQVLKYKKYKLRAIILTAEAQERDPQLIEKIVRGGFDLGMFNHYIEYNYLIFKIYSLLVTGKNHAAISTIS